MGLLVYIRLIGFTAGTLLQLFWMVVILGYRRQRNFERVFFFLCLALFFFYSGSLLAINAQIYYGEPPPLLTSFAETLFCLGLCLLPPLLLHAHIEYGKIIGFWKNIFVRRLFLVAMYAPTLYCCVRVYPQIIAGTAFDFVSPIHSLGRWYGVWLAGSLLISADAAQGFAKAAPDFPEELFHKILATCLWLAAIVILFADVLALDYTQPLITTAIALLPILPSAALGYMTYRYNFLQIGRQKNLLYAVSATFVALLYLSLVRRVSLWLAPWLPPEASAAILLFVLVIFIEPLQRTLARMLRETAQRELELVKRVAQEIVEDAKLGSLYRLVDSAEHRIENSFELSTVKIVLGDNGQANQPRNEVSIWMAENQRKISYFPIMRGDAILACMQVESHGAAISGETRAALEFLCEQLPAAIDLCRLIEEKLRLERELAERERLALVGQMAASISHNLKNPLGSIKTILQVQMENPDLPETVRGETKIVLDEIGRLSGKLNQLLQFSRPAVRGAKAQASCDARSVIEEVTGVLRHEAERRGVALEVDAADSGKVGAAAEAVNDVVSNLVVNALEATSRGGLVKVVTAAHNGCWAVTVEDDGPGIAPEVRDKMLRPFFTTKTQGTGLGLAIVARRVAEFGGKLEWESPVKNGRGTRFEVKIPVEETR